MTLMSGKVYSDAGTPSNAVGVQGDIFMQLDGLKTTYRKEGGAWTPIGNQLGTIPEFLKGVGVPPNVLGQDNQYYREVNTDAIYEKQAGVWTNIGSWTSLEIQQLLLSNGIGADLATTNHVSNIDTFIEAGAEGFYDNATTGTKPSTYGLVKAWRENSTHIYQKAETSDGKWATRKSSNGGASWPAWRIMANEDGDNTRKFKALAGVDADDVAVVGQLPAPLDLFGSTYNFLTTGQALGITPRSTVRITMIGGGGGGSVYGGANGGNGSDSELSYQGTTVLRAKGGLGAYAGYGVASGNGDQPAWPQGEIESSGELLASILTITKNTPELNVLAVTQGFGAKGLRDPQEDASPNVVRTGHAGRGADIDFLITNLSYTNNLILWATVGTGGSAGGGFSGAGGSGVVAYRT